MARQAREDLCLRELSSALAEAQPAKPAATRKAPARPPTGGSGGAGGSHARTSRTVAPPYAGLPRQRELDPSRIQLGDRLGMGGYAKVYKAILDGDKRKPVAAKRLRDVESEASQCFVDEVRIMSALSHPNLLPLVGFTRGRKPLIVMEFMARGSLFKALHASNDHAAPQGHQGQAAAQGAGGPPPRSCLPPGGEGAVALAVARGMAHLHAQVPPILHLDLSSSNILLGADGSVKIADFGTSRARRKQYASSGALTGAVQWMAPEVLRSDPFAEAADVYSYGVVLWELLTGRVPWEDKIPIQVIAQVGLNGCALEEPPPGGDDLLRDLCAECRSSTPEDRPTFAAIVSRLETRFGGASGGGGASAPSAAHPQQQPAAGRPRAPPALLRTSGEDVPARVRGVSVSGAGGDAPRRALEAGAGGGAAAPAALAAGAGPSARAEAPGPSAAVPQPAAPRPTTPFAAAAAGATAAVARPTAVLRPTPPLAPPPPARPQPFCGVGAASVRARVSPFAAFAAVSALSWGEPVGAEGGNSSPSLAAADAGEPGGSGGARVGPEGAQPAQLLSLE